jgi:Fe-S-cluster containining protein
VNCLVCRGACCEELIVSPSALSADGLAFPGALREFLTARSTAELPGPAFVIGARCPQLTFEGLCGCHDEKPLACALFPAGGDECLGAIRRRRSSTAYAFIREEGDPTVEEVFP